MPEGDEEYVCTLSAKDLEKARIELNEDPAQRISQVQTLRKWIKEQPHIKCRTDTQFLVRMLRGGKWSQLKARDMLEGLVQLGTKYPEWFKNVDTFDPKIHYLLDTGFYLPLGKDREGRMVYMMRDGVLNPSDPNIEIDIQMHMWIACGMQYDYDEGVQVNGMVFVQDMTGYTMKHMSRISMSDMKKMKDFWQGNIPGRMKGFHYYNPGTILDAIMAIFKPFMKKKYIDRMQTHDTMESVWKLFPMELFPREYLPDDYKGPCNGTIQEIVDRHKQKLLDPKYREFVKRETTEEYFCDMAKKVTAAEPAASFRKLNID